ncbi:MAG: hypothetical protein M0Q44_01550 [Methylobacter sp.]|nr:hypothetical protein [Methylobacter sp.]
MQAVPAPIVALQIGQPCAVLIWETEHDLVLIEATGHMLINHVGVFGLRVKSDKAVNRVAIRALGLGEKAVMCR